jgi:hypothetical protein
MLKHILPMALMVCPLLAVSSASADPWKDESGHRKHWKEWKEGWGESPWWKRGKGYWDGHVKHGNKWKEDWGETPWWGRGKGYWDGHFKHRRWAPPVYEPSPYDHAPTHPYYYAPPPPPPVFYDEHW